MFRRVIDEKKKPTAVERLAIDCFTGKWHQMYASLGPLATFELGGRKTMAVYAQSHVAGVLHVSNSNSPIPGLPAQSINGWARQSPHRQGIFHVTLGSSASKEPEGARFVAPGNYWILKLGPIINRKYDYALVSNSTLSSCYVLARNPDRFMREYDKTLLSEMKEMGFTTFFNRPHRTPN